MLFFSQNCDIQKEPHLENMGRNHLLDPELYDACGSSSPEAGRGGFAAAAPVFRDFFGDIGDMRLESSPTSSHQSFFQSLHAVGSSWL